MELKNHSVEKLILFHKLTNTYNASILDKENTLTQALF